MSPFQGEATSRVVENGIRVAQRASFLTRETPVGRIDVGILTVSGGMRPGGNEHHRVIRREGKPWRLLGYVGSITGAAEWLSVCETEQDIAELEIGRVVDETWERT